MLLLSLGPREEQQGRFLLLRRQQPMQGHLLLPGLQLLQEGLPLQTQPALPPHHLDFLRRQLGRGTRRCSQGRNEGPILVQLLSWESERRTGSVVSDQIPKGGCRQAAA